VSAALPALEQAILRAKGLSEAHLEALAAAGVSSKADFATIGDAATLGQLLPDVPADVAAAVMAWAVGEPPASTTGATGSSGPVSVVLDSGDVVHCVHCGAKQPKDYSSGDLCTACGKQAEPILSCFWCAASGPGTFCRQCGAEFVATAELDLAVLLRREGMSKDAVPARLRAMTQEDKDVLWGRVRKSRG
jgi:hypothetical protein